MPTSRKSATDKRVIPSRRRFDVRIGDVVPVVAHAVAVFGDEAKASHWFATKLPLFDDRSPSQVLEQKDGVALVEQVLSRIEHNIPS